MILGRITRWKMIRITFNIYLTFKNYLSFIIMEWDGTTEQFIKLNKLRAIASTLLAAGFEHKVPKTKSFKPETLYYGWYSKRSDVCCDRALWEVILEYNEFKDEDQEELELIYEDF